MNRLTRLAGTGVVTAVLVPALALPTLAAPLPPLAPTAGAGSTSVATSPAASQAGPGRVPVRLGPDLPAPVLVPERSHAVEAARPGTAASQVSPTALSTWVVTYSAGFPTSARAAFQRSVDIWSRTVASPVPVRVSANWRDLGDPNLLGQAGPTGYEMLDGRAYPVAMAEAMAGAGRNGTDADIAAEFNSAQPSWSFDTGAPSSQQIDFSTVVLHELGHGLGLIGSMDTVATRGYFGTQYTGGLPDGRLPLRYDDFTRSALPTPGPLLDKGNGSEALGAALTSGSVTWTGARGIAAAGGSAPVLYAPATWQPGSSYSHLDEARYPPGDPDSLMTPMVSRGEAIRDPGDIAVGMLQDMGYLSPIDAHYRALGGAGSFLGQPTGPEQVAADGAGRSRSYQGGTIWWSTAGGAAELHGLIGRTWTALGGTGSALGYPRTDELGTPDGRGRYNHFVNGSVYWTPDTGAHEVRGSIRATWAALGSERSALGYPVSDEQGTTDGRGRYNEFQGGSAYWRPATGAHEVRGSIRQTWLRLGADRAALGYPTSDEVATSDGRGRYNTFESGTVLWSPSTGAHEVRGAIAVTWRALGADRSAVGYPVSDERATADGRGRYNDFTAGSVLWSPATGAHEVRGTIRAAWSAAGAEAGSLGYPLTDEYAAPGGRAEDFQGGRLVWSASTGQVTRTSR